LTTYAALPRPGLAEMPPVRLERLPQAVARRDRASFYPAAIVLALAAGGLSVAIGPRGLSYDVWSWLVWGRELIHGTLSTAGSGSSFKPLPVAVTALLGWTSAAPMIWLVLARAGAVFAALLAFRVGWRLAGPLAGFIAAVGLLASDQYLGFLAVSGRCEPIDAALTLVAVDAHLSRRRAGAVACLALAGLVRIEMWAFVLVYALWWLHAGRGQVRLNRRRAAILAGLLVALPMVWFLPDLVTTGDLLRSAQDARVESQGGPLLAAVPFLATFKEAAGLLPWPFTVAFCGELIVGSTVFVRRGRIRATWVLALAALALVLVEAVMVQFDLDTAVPRYLLQSVAVGTVVAGCFVVDAARWLVGRVRRVERAGLPVPGWVVSVAALATPVVFLVAAAPSVPRISHYGSGMRNDRALAVLARQLPGAIAEAGGRAHVVACGPVTTTTLQVPAVAWNLRLHMDQVGDRVAPSSGTVLSRGHDLPRLPAEWSSRYTTIGRVVPSGSRWRVQSTCPPASWLLAHPAQKDVALGAAAAGAGAAAASST